MSRVRLADVSRNSRNRDQNAYKTREIFIKYTQNAVQFLHIELPISQKPKGFLKAVSLSLYGEDDMREVDT